MDSVQIILVNFFVWSFFFWANQFSQTFYPRQMYPSFLQEFKQFFPSM